MYKVKVTCGAYDAPSIYVDASSANEAIVLAMQRSGLARFSNWIFIPTRLC